jgi:hypothetical protein
MDKQDFVGKTIGEVIDEDTNIPGGHLTPDEVERVKSQELKSFGISEKGNVTLLKNYSGMECVIVLIDGKAKAMFYIYELHGTDIDLDFELVIAYGHETICLYRLSDGHYKEIHTR